MGLLDSMFGGDPSQQALTAMAMNLIGANGKNTNAAFGNAGLLGMNTYQNAQQNQQNQARQGLLEQLTKQQIDTGALEMEQKRRAVEQQNKIAQLQTQFARTPQQNALQNGQGPTLSNAANIGPAGFDYQGYANALAGIDPMAALSLQTSLRKDKPKVESYKPGETVGYVDDSGQFQKVYSVPDSDLPNKPFRLVNGEVVPNQPYQDYELRKASLGAARSQPTPYFQFLSTPEGIVAANARDGTVSRTDINGRPVIKSADSPSLQGQIAGAKKSGQVFGESSATSQIELPKIVASAEETLKLTDDLLKHPGFSQAVGASSMLGVQKIPGTQAKAFMVRLDQLKGKQFLEAFQSLKGSGQITEVEGEKATNALARMDNASTEDEFIQATRDFQAVIKRGVDRAKEKAGASSVRGPVSAPTFLGFE